MRIARIISGGQTGADRAALDAALDEQVPHGGYCPRGRRAEDGMVPFRYHLQETSSVNYLARTEQNVQEADATLIFTMGEPDGGNRYTIQFARRHGKPYLHLDLERLDDPGAIGNIMTWFNSDAFAGDLFTPPKSVIILNVAGNRESKAPGIHARVRRIIRQLLVQQKAD